MCVESLPLPTASKSLFSVFPFPLSLLISAFSVSLLCCAWHGAEEEGECLGRRYTASSVAAWERTGLQKYWGSSCGVKTIKRNVKEFKSARTSDSARNSSRIAQVRWEVF